MYIVVLFPIDQAIPPYIHRMCQLGYPPSWRGQALARHRGASGLAFVDRAADEEVDNGAARLEKQMEPVRFPGFNSPFSPGIDRLPEGGLRLTSGVSTASVTRKRTETAAEKRKRAVVEEQHMDMEVDIEEATVNGPTGLPVEAPSQALQGEPPAAKRIALHRTAETAAHVIPLQQDAGGSTTAKAPITLLTQHHDGSATVKTPTADPTQYHDGSTITKEPSQALTQRCGGVPTAKEPMTAASSVGSGVDMAPAERPAPTVADHVAPAETGLNQATAAPPALSGDGAAVCGRHPTIAVVAHSTGAVVAVPQVLLPSPTASQQIGTLSPQPVPRNDTATAQSAPGSDTPQATATIQAPPPVNPAPSIALLLSAVRQNNLGDVRRLVAVSPALARATDADGCCAMHVASACGRSDIATLLLEAGADVNATTIRGDTPLHNACFGGWLEIVKLLCSAGANVRESGVPPLVVWLSLLRSMPCLADGSCYRDANTSCALLLRDRLSFICARASVLQ